MKNCDIISAGRIVAHREHRNTRFYLVHYSDEYGQLRLVPIAADALQTLAPGEFETISEKLREHRVALPAA